jgi:hypothetical protein
MKRRAVAYALAILLVAGPALAGTAKTYQVTGPVVDVSADTITVKKGNDNWEIAKDASTKTSGDVKKGDKVTVMYRMTATSIESKAAAATPKKKK